jgi:hypothetical protein
VQPRPGAFLPRGTAKSGEAFTFFNRSQETLELAGGKLPLGWVTEIAHSAKLDNLGELKIWYHNGGDGRIEMRLAPANNNQMTVRLSDVREASPSIPPRRLHRRLDVMHPAGTGSP